jgi:hypothetical protein
MQIGKILVFATAVGFVGILGASTACSSSSFDCAAKPAKNCPNDPEPTAPTQAEIDQCKKCQSQAAAAADCTKGAATCGADGKTDPASALAVLTKCAQQLSAYQNCVNKM